MNVLLLSCNYLLVARGLFLKVVLSSFFSRLLACFAGNTNCIVRAKGWTRNDLVRRFGAPASAGFLRPSGDFV
jgi:hypothetical protein